jgi:uridine kinase
MSNGLVQDVRHGVRDERNRRDRQEVWEGAVRFYSRIPFVIIPTRRLSAVDTVVAAIRARSVRPRGLIVAIDGRSGSGKSTVAEAVAQATGAVIVPCDDFFAAGITDEEWDRRTPAQRAADAIGWRRLKREAIEPLRTGHPARWYAFDFLAGPRSDGTYPLLKAPTERPPMPVVLLDGAYSARPELADVLDLSVLVEAATATRQARLTAREAPDFLRQWHARWDPAEEYYFSQVRPPSAFDVVVQTDSY